MKFSTLYICAFEVVESGRDRASGNQLLIEMLSLLAREGFQIVWFKEQISGDRVFQEIEHCDGLLAIIDRYWLSSTWKAFEATYASGDTPKPDRTFIPKPIPTFLMPVSSNLDLGFFKKLDNTVVVSPQPELAVRAIAQKLNAINTPAAS